MSTFLNIEILQSLPFSNANRDDSGQPKTLYMGGTTRGRLSSQSIKRAARFYGTSVEKGYGLPGDESGGEYFRTQYVKYFIIDELKERELDPSNYEKRIDEIFTAKILGEKKKKDGDSLEKSSALVVLTKEEISKLTDLVVSSETINGNSIVEILKTSSKRDLALWGRFFASSSKATLDGSAQVAHSFTTHSVKLEDDFFTGLDDGAFLYSNDAGAGHPGDSFYLNGVFYKYANVNIEETLFNIGQAEIEGKRFVLKGEKEDLVEETKQAISVFLNNFIKSVPQGKIRSTAHTTLPNYIRVTLANGSPVNGSIAFEKAIEGKDLMNSSIEKLEETHSKLNKIFGSPNSEFIINLNSDESLSLSELVEKVNVEIENIVRSQLEVIDFSEEELKEGQND